jgi:hypothetical protein
LFLNIPQKFLVIVPKVPEKVLGSSKKFFEKMGGGGSE